MKRRVISLFLTVAVASTLMLSGCAKNETVGEAAVPETTAAEEKAEEQDTPVEEASTETAESTENQEDNWDAEEAEGMGDYISDCPVITLEKETANYYDDDENWTIESYYTKVSAFSAYADCDIDALNASLQTATDDGRIRVEDEIARIQEELKAEDSYPGMERSKDYPLTSITTDYYVKRADSNIISLVEMIYDFNGGTHASTLSFGWNFDAKTGEIISLEDVITDMDGFKTYADEKIKEQMSDMVDNKGIVFFDNAEALVSDFMAQNYYFDACGIEFLYYPEMIAPFACGDIIFTFPYEDLFPYMKPEYIPNVEDGVSELQSGKLAQSTFINGLMVGFENTADYSKGYINAEKTQYCLTDNGFIRDAYLYKRMEKIYIIANYTFDDRNNAAIFDVTDGSVNMIFTYSDMAFKTDSLTADDVFTLQPSEGDTCETIPINNALGIEY